LKADDGRTHSKACAGGVGYPAAPRSAAAADQGTAMSARRWRVRLTGEHVDQRWVAQRVRVDIRLALAVLDVVGVVNVAV